MDNRLIKFEPFHFNSLLLLNNHVQNFADLLCMAFPFEDLEVYKRSIQFVSDVESLLERENKKISKGITDQLSRAALSIPLNIAEGNGRWHKGDKRQFFWIARGSVFECIPIIEILRIKEAITDAKKAQLREQLEIIGKMLTRLIQVHTE